MAAVWAVLVTVDTGIPLDENTLVALENAAEYRDASVANRADGPGYRVIVDVTADEPLAAAHEGVRFACDEVGAGLRASVVDVRATTPEQLEVEAFTPDTPELVSAADVAEILGVTRQRVHQLATAHSDFPAPYARLATGPIWTLPTIEHFRGNWDRRPGRRRMASVGGP